MSTRTWTKIAGIAGIATIVWYFIGLAIVAALRPGYSHLAQVGSDLGRGPHWWLFTILLEGFGLALALFAVGLHHALHGRVPDPHLTRARLFLLLAAAGVAMAGVCSEYRAGDTAIWHGILHGIGFLVLMGGTIAAQWRLAPALRNLPGWRPLGTYARISAPATTLLLIADLTLPSALPGTAGLFQRILLAWAFGWHLATGIHLLRTPTISEAPSTTPAPAPATRALNDA